MSASRVAANIHVVAAIGLLVWNHARVEPRLAGELAPAAMPTNPDEVATRPETRPASAAPAPIAPKPFRESGEDEATAQATKPAEGQGRTLTVVQAPDDAPAAGAAVEFTPVSLNGTTPTGPTVDLTADDEGIVRLPKFKGHARVRGALGTRSGCNVISAGDWGSLRLRLGPGLSVLVVDAGGKPQVGVPVVVIAGAPWRPVVDRAQTREDGIALLSPTGPERLNFDKDTESKVALGLPLDEPVEASFDPAKVPDVPVKLVLTATGRVSARLVNSGGQPFTGAALVQIDVMDRNQRRFNGESPGLVRMTAVGGLATFPFVGLTPRLEVSASPADPALRAVHRTLEGPRVPGEVTVTLECGGLATRVTGRLVKGDGKPLRRTRCELLLPASVEEPTAGMNREANKDSVTTDGDGRFAARFDVDPSSVATGDLVLSIARDRPGVHVAGSAYVVNNQEVKAALSDAVRAGSVALGDILVPEVDFIAAGIVVSNQGPIGGAKAMLMVRSRQGWRQAWFGNDFIEAATGLDGRFELRGKTEGTGFGVTAQRDGWFCGEAIPFEAGARDVKIVMVKAGGLQGSIKGLEQPDSLVWRESPVAVSVVKAGAKAPRTGAYDVDERPDPDRHELDVRNGKFSAKALRPGTYSVEFYLNRFTPEGSEPLMVVEGVVVNGGEINRDPRLQEIDLAKLLSTRIVTVVDERSHPLKGVKIGARAADARGEFMIFVTGSDGRAVVATPGGGIEIVVALKGYRAATVPEVTGDTTVTLQKTVPKRVTIKLAEGAEFPPPPYYLGASLSWLCGATEKPPSEPASRDPRSDSFETVRFGQDRVATIVVDTPGIYEVQVWLYEQSARGNSGSSLGDRGPTVSVGEEGEVTVTAVLDAATLKGRLERDKK